MRITSRDPCIEFVPLWRFPHDVTWKKLIACPYSSIGENSCLSLISGSWSNLAHDPVSPALPPLPRWHWDLACLWNRWIILATEMTEYHLQFEFSTIWIRISEQTNWIQYYPTIVLAPQAKILRIYAGSLITQPFSRVKWVENAV